MTTLATNQLATLDELVMFDPALSTDGDFSGLGDTVQVDENSFGFAAVLSLTIADGHWDMANASASATPEMNDLVLAIDTGTGAGKRVLRKGYIREDAWTWTVGGAVYVSTTNGTLTQTAPSGSSQFVKRVGYAKTADILWFDPNGSPLIELVA